MVVDEDFSPKITTTIGKCVTFCGCEAFAHCRNYTGLLVIPPEASFARDSILEGLEK